MILNTAPSSHFICLDIETTGLNPDRDKIIEIGIALVNLKTREIEKTFESFVSPGITLPQFVTNLTGIKDEDLKNAPPITEILEKILEFIGDLPVMGHNISFDLDFLNINGFDLKNQRLDSMDIAHITFPKEKSYSLEVLGKKLDIKEYGKHRALKDVTVNIEAVFKLMDIYFSQNTDHEKITEILEKSETPWKDILLFTSKNFKKADLQKKEPPAKKTLQTQIKQTSDRTLMETSCDLDDLIPQNPEFKTIIATPELPDTEEIFQLLSPNQYLDKNLFTKLLEKSELTSEETTFALKILSLGGKETISRRDLHLTQNIKNLWFDYAHKKFPKEIVKQLEENKVILLDHFTLARISLKNEKLLTGTHLIINEIDEFYHNAKKSLTATYSEKRFANSDLPQETKDKITMLMGYLGIVYEKYAEYYGLRIDSEIGNTQEWAKCADMIVKITDLIAPLSDSEEKALLEFMQEWKKSEIELIMTQENEPIMTITPRNIGEILSQKIWPFPKKLTLVSRAITFKGEHPQGKFLKALLNLPLDTTIEINDKNEPYIETVNDMPNPKSEEFTIKAGQKLARELPILEKPGFILTNSKKAAEQLHSLLALELKEKGLTVLAQDISGGIGKIGLTYENSKETTVLIGTYDFWKTMRPNIKTLIIFKLPFPPPCDLPFQDYALPVTMLKIKKMSQSAEKIISLDNRTTQYL